MLFRSRPVKLCLLPSPQNEEQDPEPAAAKDHFSGRGQPPTHPHGLLLLSHRSKTISSPSPSAHQLSSLCHALNQPTLTRRLGPSASPTHNTLHPANHIHSPARRLFTNYHLERQRATGEKGGGGARKSRAIPARRKVAGRARYLRFVRFAVCARRRGGRVKGGCCAGRRWGRVDWRGGGLCR